MTVRIRAAAFAGKMKEAATLATEWQTRMDAASRRTQTGQGLMDLAIDEALVGLTAEARTRIATAQEDELLLPNALDERLVVAAIVKDGEAARELLPLALAEVRKQAANAPAERAFRALALMAEGKPGEAIPLLEPVTFDPEHADIVTIWTLAQTQLKDWPAASKGLALMTEDTWQRGLGTGKAFAMVELARAQATLGNRDEARRRYQAFFDFWKDADADIPLLLQAREEFSKL